MSILNAKKIADLKAEISANSNVLSAKQDAFRKSMNEDIVSEFSSFMKEHGFEISESALSVTANYKALSVQIKLPKEDDRFIGVYHSFDLMADGKTYFVKIIPKWSGASNTHPRSDDSLESLEHNLQRVKSDIQNLKLVSYQFSFSPDGNTKARANALKAEPDNKVDTVAALLEQVI